MTCTLDRGLNMEGEKGCSLDRALNMEGEKGSVTSISQWRILYRDYAVQHAIEQVSLVKPTLY